jgi:serine/threonine protein kinase
MATVYAARHAQLGKHVALKAMHPHLAADPIAAARFLREGKAAAQIHHPHVVDVFDVGMNDGVPFLVMELLDGEDLAALLRERRKMPLEELVGVMMPVLSAVQAAHAVGVIHRDLKPSNVVLARRDDGSVSPTILDFGISKVEGDAIEGDLTASAVLLGTVHYMSPEQTRGGRNAGPASDQYALGVILYECATGVKPFSGNTPYSLMHAIVSARVQPPSALEPSLPRAFDEVVLRAMHRDPAKRFASVRELGASLLPFASEDVRKRWASDFGVDLEAVGRTPRRRTGPVSVAVAGALLLLAGGALALRSSARGESVQAATPSPVPSAAPAGQAPATPIVAPVEPSSATAASPDVSAVMAPASVRRAARAAGRPAASPPAGPSASATTPERGTNGALIVE